MTTIYSPVQRGFDERLAMIDRCQIALLREIVGQYGAGRLFLKGGMAMRAVFGSLRLTKDIDFDRDPSLSLSSAKDGLRHAIVRAAANAGIRQPEAQVTKASGTTVRVRLAGRSVSGIDLRFEVEVSGRGLPAPRYRRKEMVIPPASYGIAPFVVESFTNDMLAAMKVAAAMSAALHAPRDIYDLHDLMLAGVDPSDVLSSSPPAMLKEIRNDATDKLERVTYARAREELTPYLPSDVRDALKEDQWISYTIEVGAAIERWATSALEKLEQRGAQIGVVVPDAASPTSRKKRPT